MNAVRAKIKMERMNRARQGGFHFHAIGEPGCNIFLPDLALRQTRGENETES